MNQHFHREISELYTATAKLGGMVEEAIGKALISLKDGDEGLARDVQEGDNEIDRLEVEIEEHCLSILALYQPVARDLRFIVSVLKVTNELEHMGDLAESIAFKTKSIGKSQVAESKIQLFKMGEQTQRMVAMALDALLKEDAEKARQVIRMDDEIDDHHRANHRVVSQAIKGAAEAFTLAELGLLSVSRSLERIADMATSIAQDVIYLVEATIVRHKHRYD